jgi:glycosyltransferase involved in cell wall biosynthesis
LGVFVDAPWSVELVVVDNDVLDSARPIVADLAKAAVIPVTYVHEPRPGVANARNAALAVSRGEFLAFLDDDEEAMPLWLAELLSVQQRFDADVVFGPIQGRTPGAALRHKAFFETFYSRFGPSQDVLIQRHYGCGNSLVRRAAIPASERPFDTAFNRRGGEDDVLFSTMRRQGARFAWAARASVWEDPGANRLTLSYTLRRGFAYGQGATSLRAAFGSKAAVVWSMSTGLGQAVVFLALAGLTRLFAPDRSPFWLLRAAKGLGKLLWWSAFHLQFYGLAAAPARDEALA